MEKVVGEEINKGKTRVEASQKAMIAMVALTGILCLAVVGGVVLFSSFLKIM